MRVLHLVALTASAVLAFFVGVWAYFLPQGFYDTFPGQLGSWISIDGPFNEHLIRDVGAMYLALGVASVGGLVWRSTAVYRVLGLAWTVFGLLHFLYHATHLEHMSASDATAEMVSLAVNLALGIILLVPARSEVGRA